MNNDCPYSVKLREDMIKTFLELHGIKYSFKDLCDCGARHQKVSPLKRGNKLYVKYQCGHGRYNYSWIFDLGVINSSIVFDYDWNLKRYDIKIKCE
jgi:hypothetical protein